MAEQGIVAGNEQNEVKPKQVNTRSRFPMSYHHYDTMRFGEIHPHFVMECVPDDKVTLRSEHDVRSYTLKAPLMSKIQLKKDYFAISGEAILPNNWDKIYTNPVIGDDVPGDAGTYVEDFTSLITTYLNKLATIVTQTVGSATATDGQKFTALFNYLLTAEMICSTGSLTSSLGIHLNSCWYFLDGVIETSQNVHIDEYLDKHVAAFITNNQNATFSLTIGNDTWTLKIDKIRVMLELMRDNLGMFTINTTNSDSLYLDRIDCQCVFDDPDNNKEFGLDLKRLFAYQIACAHYYSNDHVDYIYTAELYRQYIGNLYSEAHITGGENVYRQPAFQYNGGWYEYDKLSAKIFHLFIRGKREDDTTALDKPELVYPYLQAIFGYKHSLRYVDYFVGAKTRPLAVGDVNVDVNNGTPNYVSIIDVTQNIQMQRFLNAVNRAGRKFENYIAELFGTYVAPDYHNPFYIGHTADDIYGQEIENTGQAQMQDALSVTSQLRSNAKRFEFEFECDRPCIIIGVSYFDVPRSYWNTIERQNFAKDRFDYFNKYMQFIGDQPVYAKELAPMDKDTDNFGYQMRHAEYKQRYNQASGGFVRNLPGYTFLNDVEMYDHEITDNPMKISPSFIRSKSWELDRFYVSLTGYSLGSYFHFICDNNNDCEASRPMAASPSIL